MWFGFNEENTWYPLNIQRVNQILRMNQEGKKPATLDKDVEEVKVPVETLNSDLARMDQKFKGKSKKKKRKKGSSGQPDQRHEPRKDQKNEQQRTEGKERSEGRDQGRPNRHNRKPKPGNQR